MTDDDGPMTVGKLRDVLANLPDDRLVVVSSDPAGNRYSEADSAVTSRSLWFADERQIYSPEDIEDEGIDTYNRGVPCLVLWPTN